MYSTRVIYKFESTEAADLRNRFLFLNPYYLRIMYYPKHYRFGIDCFDFNFWISHRMIENNTSPVQGSLSQIAECGRMSAQDEFILSTPRCTIDALKHTVEVQYI